MSRFTPAELEVMQILCQHGAMKPAEILGHLDRPVSNAALRSVLRILLEKGHVTRRKQGKAFYYRAKPPKRGMLQRRVRELVNIFFEGSATGLIANLIENEDLSADEIRDLVKVAERKVAKSKTKPGAKREDGR